MWKWPRNVWYCLFLFLFFSRETRNPGFCVKMSQILNVRFHLKNNSAQKGCFCTMKLSLFYILEPCLNKCRNPDWLNSFYSLEPVVSNFSAASENPGRSVIFSSLFREWKANWKADILSFKELTFRYNTRLPC